MKSSKNYILINLLLLMLNFNNKKNYFTKLKIKIKRMDLKDI